MFSRRLHYCGLFFFLFIMIGWFSYYAITFQRTWVRPKDTIAVSKLLGRAVDACFMVDIHKPGMTSNGYRLYGVFIQNFNEPALVEAGWKDQNTPLPFNPGHVFKLIVGYQEKFYEKVIDGKNTVLVHVSVSESESIVFVSSEY